MPQIQLFMGEKDGFIITIPAVVTRPEVYYATPSECDEQIRAVKGPKARMAVREKLATLAYVFDKTVRKEKVGWEHQFVRCPEQDKVTDPATEAKE
jgi:hypothetical protein